MKLKRGSCKQTVWNSAAYFFTHPRWTRTACVEAWLSSPAKPNATNPQSCSSKEGNSRLTRQRPRGSNLRSLECSVDLSKMGSPISSRADEDAKDESARGDSELPSLPNDEHSYFDKEASSFTHSSMRQANHCCTATRAIAWISGSSGGISRMWNRALCLVTGLHRNSKNEGSVCTIQTTKVAN